MEDIKLGLAAQVTPSEVERAEALLHDIAAMLLRLPMRGHVPQLHVRALRLKRRVSGWTGQVPEPTVQGTMSELVDLHREARDVAISRSRSGCGRS
jgi:hypothetical protein